MPTPPSLFLRSTYQDSWNIYTNTLQSDSALKWDYIFLTASNEAQAEAFRMQIEDRLKQGFLPKETKYKVLPDPDGKRVGSGGATFNVLKNIIEGEGEPFRDKRTLVIHSGGDSKRVPQYSAVGKLFSPVPRRLPDGRASTLFDEFIIAMSGVPSRIKDGMLVLSGDVLLLFNPLQIDSQINGAAAISIKETVGIGKDHGVFLNDGHGFVKNFLHKQTEEKLAEYGAVNKQGMVDLDTGAILLSAELLDKLSGLICTDGKIDSAKFEAFVNERSRVSFYGDMLYPLASASTLEQYYLEKPEGDLTDELHECRTQLWEVLHNYDLKLICLSPAQFIHFGTTSELSKLMSEGIGGYEFLDWSKNVCSAGPANSNYSTYCAYVGRRANVGGGSYIEESYVLDNSSVGENSVISNVRLSDHSVPENVVLHGLPLKNEKYTVRIYGVNDNPKNALENTSFAPLLEKVNADMLWDNGKPHDLWNAKVYPVCNSHSEAINAALRLNSVVLGKADNLTEYINSERISLCDSFNSADLTKVMQWRRELETRILCRNFIDRLDAGEYYKTALDTFGERGITAEMFETLCEDAEGSDLRLKIRIYYALSHNMKAKNIRFNGVGSDSIERSCFDSISDSIYNAVTARLPDNSSFKIRKDKVDVRLPVRVNFGGGWTDTPPYCTEMGGVVLNAALKINGELPIRVTVKKLDRLHIEFESKDIGVHGLVTDINDVRDCHNPYDPYALHKAALIACGLIPLKDNGETLEELFKRIGGGIYLSTCVVGIPKGSGLGTSSILAGACIKALNEFFGFGYDDDKIYDIVLCMEQIMSTGGGWQDQVGGLTNGFKLITSKPGTLQKLNVEALKIGQATMQELQQRFALIYTGQRRLARNLLRDVVGGYIGGRPKSVKALNEMKPTAALMKFALEQGNVDEFARLLNKHWELSCMLDSGSTNTCIDYIFSSCDDLIDGRMICGAGGGGFLQVILKKGVTKAELHDRLMEIFQDSGVDVWNVEFI